MSKRSYEDLPTADTAVAIFKDVIYDGSSYGWDTADVVGIAIVKRYLEPYNIHYVGDGVWRYEKPEKVNVNSPRFKIGQNVYYFGENDTVNSVAVGGIEIKPSGIYYRLSGMSTVKAEDELFEDPAIIYNVKIKKIQERIDALEQELRKVEEAKKDYWY